MNCEFTASQRNPHSEKRRRCDGVNAVISLRESHTVTAFSHRPTAYGALFSDVVMGYGQPHSGGRL